MESGTENQQPIIVVKKHGKHADHHGGAWKVAYADFVTAMMAFFLVMWLVNQSEVVKESVGGYFRDPVGFSDKAGEGVLQGGPSIMSHPKPPSSDESERQKNEAEAREELKEAGESIMEAMQQLPGLLKVSDRIDVEMTDEGLRIQLMESGDSTFFDLGSSELASSGISAVSAIGEIVAPLEYDIIIEGHTDSRRYTKSEVYSNWELSSDRANTARRLLEMSGVAPERFDEIRAFADNQLRYTANPEDARNRRIAIIIVNPFSLAPGGKPAAPDQGKMADLNLR
jgi:chemotaxis protein MotB